MTPVNKKILKFNSPSFFWALCLALIALGVPGRVWSATLKVIDPSPKTEFESQRLVSMQQKLGSCKACSVENITPYTAEGQFDPKQIPATLTKSELKGSVLVVNWNRGASKEDQVLLDHLKKSVQEGLILIASAGKPADGEPILPLGKTLWGQVPDIILVGELQEKEKLVAGTYFGPEMLTALGPKDLTMGEGAGALAFSVKMLPVLAQKKDAEWVPFLKEKRSKHRRLWPSLNDFFGK